MSTVKILFIVVLISINHFTGSDAQEVTQLNNQTTVLEVTLTRAEESTTFAVTDSPFDDSSEKTFQNQSNGDAPGKIALFDQENYAGRISTGILVFVGLTGNTATLFALRGPPFNNIPSSYILSSLAVADTLTLITVQFNNDFITDFIGYDVRAVSTEACKIFFFILRFGKILSSWFVVLVCSERFVAICFPLHTKQICTKLNALRGIVGVIIMSGIYCGLWTLSSEKIGSRCNPNFSTEDTKLRSKLLILFGSGLITILPMSILVILTPTMCVVICRHYTARKQLSSASNQDATKISAMLISISIAFIVLQLPILVAHNIALARGENLYTSTYLPLYLLNKFGNILEGMNYSCNFFLYVACNGVFRRKVFGICTMKKNVETVTQISMMSVTST